MKVITFALFIFILLAFPAVAAAATLDISFDKQAVAAGEDVTLKVEMDSGSDPVNAVQVNLEFPEDQFEFQSIDSSETVLAIKAQESAKNGLVIIARGSIQPVVGKGLISNINFKAKKDGANLSLIKTTSDSAILRSSDNQNILPGSTVLSQKAKSPEAQTKPPSQVQNMITSWWGKVFGFIKSLFQNK